MQWKQVVINGFEFELIQAACFSKASSAPGTESAFALFNSERSKDPLSCVIGGYVGDFEIGQYQVGLLAVEDFSADCADILRRLAGVLENTGQGNRFRLLRSEGLLSSMDFADRSVSLGFEQATNSGSVLLFESGDLLVQFAVAEPLDVR